MGFPRPEGGERFYSEAADKLVLVFPALRAGVFNWVYSWKPNYALCTVNYELKESSPCPSLSKSNRSFWMVG
jgi:hypothetical protein